MQDLLVGTIEYRLPPEEQVCPRCGGALHDMSYLSASGGQDDSGPSKTGQACTLHLQLAVHDHRGAGFFTFAIAAGYSITETAKENGLIPFEYLRYSTERLPNPGDNDLDQLLPWSKSLPGTCRAGKLT